MFSISIEIQLGPVVLHKYQDYRKLETDDYQSTDNDK